VPKHSSICLFSKTSYPDVNHIPILVPTYFQPVIDFSSYDYIIATSKEVFIALDKIGDWKSLPVLAISESTAAFAKKKGAKILDIADGYGKSIVSIVNEKYKGLKALHPHAKVIAFDLHESLSADGISVDSIIVYETSCSKDKAVELPSDAICIFTSPSSVKCFEEKYTFLPTYKIVCIGETTASALPKGLKFALSEKTSVESTIERAKSLL
jgi:uroporphyrinogen-III synthase